MGAFAIVALLLLFGIFYIVTDFGTRHTGYRVGVPHGGYWREMLNSDAREYAGSGMGNLGGVQAEEIPTHARPFSLKLTLPPLAAVFFKAQ